MNYLPTDLIAQSPDWAFADFEQRVWQIVNELQRREIQAVALWFEDGAKLACTLLACWHANVRTLLLPNFTSESILWTAGQAELWLTDTPINIVSSGIKSAVCFFDEFALNGQYTLPNRPLDQFSSDSAFLLKTSGSTGTPKTIVKTAAQLWRNAQICADTFGFKSGNQVRSVCTVSIQHLYGLICQIMMPLVLGWQIERKQQFYPEDVALACKRAKKSVLISSPTMLASIDWQRLAFPNLQGIVSAGGLLSGQIAQAINTTLGFPVTDFYGSTEAGAIAYRRGSTLWQAMPTATIGVDERSALWIEADWVSGREQSEDIIKLSENCFEMLGRADRIIKLGDKRLSLAGIEQGLMTNPLVCDCYIGQHPEKQRLACWLALSEQGIELFREQGRKAVIEALKTHLAKNQEKTAIPRFWRFSDTLPRNSQSKISRLAFEATCRQEQRDPIWHNQEKSENLQVFQGKVPLDLVYFKGHFANFPLVPGVVELQWISDKINEFFQHSQTITRIDNLKFQKFLRPNDEMELTLDWEAPKQRMKFQLKTDGEPCSSGLVILA
ncbi:AMP-binding protein [Rodentibacter sp. JRC1]|uniref:AMP-binding protein n=1 Tax=Rodentibacter TaxID=1960084 RepID=UPI001CFE09D7|nr:AMP-binding protein [Rodentibacter sp. JRC1]GJI56058.1 AMP-binding protein [Rodentibacter sp. JRC1]